MRLSGRFRLTLLVAGLAFAVLAKDSGGFRTADRQIRVDSEGVMRWTDDGREVALLGVNYYTPFNWDYRQIAKKGLDHKTVIRQDVAHFRRLGLDVLRVHCHESDISRQDGSLRENEHLELLDYLIAECASNGIQTVLTPIAAWGGDWFSGAAESFSYNVGVQRLFAETNRWPVQQRYLEDFGRHVNRFTGRCYADDPAILCFELVNEPKYPKGTTGRQIADYANMLCAALKRSGTKKPVFYSATWASTDQKADAGVQALPYLRTEGVSGVCYCTGLLNRKAHEGPMLSRIRKSSLASLPETNRLAKIIYEFDAADVPGAYMYPAMAAMFRHEGVQIAAQFQYDPTPLAEENSSYQTHYLNLVYTPAKALSLAIAAEAFRRLPRGCPFSPAKERMSFPPFRIDAVSNLSELVTADRFYHTADTSSRPPSVEGLQAVWGCGSSCVVRSTGNGAYFLDRLESGIWRLEVFPSVKVVADPYTGAKGPKTVLADDLPRLTIRLPDLGPGFSARSESGSGSVAFAVDGEIVLKPGAYVLTRTDAVTSAVPAHRRYGAWESCRIGAGGFLQHAAWSPVDANRIYVGTDVGGVYRTDDGGRTWRMLHGALAPQLYGVRDVVAHPRRRDVFLIAAGDGYHPFSGIWRSDDAGGSFRQVLAGDFWGNEETRVWGDVLVCAPDGSETVYAGVPDKGLWRSDDFGVRWRCLGPTNVYPRAVVVDRTDANRIWIVADRRKPGSRWGKCAEGLFLTEDGGRTWLRVDDGVYPGEFVQDPCDPKLLHGAFRDVPPLQWSGDRGRTWHPYDNPEIHPLPTDQFHDGKCQALAVGPDFVLAGCSGGNFYRLEGGMRRWRKLEPVSCDFGDWYANTASGFRPFGACLGWIGVSPHDPRRWLFTDWYGLYQSDDAGANWRISVDGVEMTVVHALAQDAANPNRIHCGMADVGYLRSDDGGVSFGNWRRGDLRDNVKCLVTCATDSRRVYAIGPSGWGWMANQLSVSRDGGGTWCRPKGCGLPDLNGKDGARCSTVAVHPRHPDEIYLVVSGPVMAQAGGVYRSMDAGENWQWIGDGLPAEPLFADSIWEGGGEIAVSPDGACVVSSSKNGKVFCRQSGGIWSESRLPGAGGRVVADARREGRFYLNVRDKGLFRSEDGGVAWRCVIKGKIAGVCADLAKSGRIAFISRKGAAWSEDGGDKWNPLPGLPPRAGSVLCFAGDWLVCGTGGSGVFRIPLARTVRKGPAGRQFVAAEQASASIGIYHDDPECGVELCWTWSAKNDPNVPSEWQGHFLNPSECKPMDDGRLILMTASGGAFAGLDMASGHCLFFGDAGGNPHSIERLPDGRIAVASSTGGTLKIFDVKDSPICPPRQRAVTAMTLVGGHGLVWDASRNSLFALGYTNLYELAYLPETMSVAVKRRWNFAKEAGDAFGHDLQPDGSGGFFFTNHTGVWRIDPETGTITLRCDVRNVKSFSPAAGGDLLMVPRERWWSDALLVLPSGAADARQARTIDVCGARFYKARWL